MAAATSSPPLAPSPPLRRPAGAGRIWPVPAAIILATLAAPLLGGLFPADSAWYAALRKPAFQPPGWAFGVVWPVLYVLMAVAAVLVWRSPGASPAARRRALVLYFGQLALNAAWTPLFFGLRQPVWALIDLALLNAAAWATAWAFWRVRPAAGALLLPYLAWLAFAAALNTAIVVLNR